MDELRDIVRLPGLEQSLLFAPLFLLLSALSLEVAAQLKRAGWKTGYSRKTFHFLTFATAALTQTYGGRPLLNLFGSMASLVVVAAILAGEGQRHYEALAREKDAPHRTWYVVVPYFATLAGGLVANLFAAQAAICGYLVCGLGDAVGEPVGTRWGRHRYRVPAPGRVVSYRSYEGSTAVFLVSWLSIVAGLAILGAELDGATLLRSGVVALGAAATEAVAPHGGDNFFLIVLPAIGVELWILA